MLPAPRGVAISNRPTILVPRFSDTVLGYDWRRMVWTTHAQNGARWASDESRRETPGFYIISLRLERVGTASYISLQVVSPDRYAAHDRSGRVRPYVQRLHARTLHAVAPMVPDSRGGARRQHRMTR
jgi:hypothetical protein